MHAYRRLIQKELDARGWKAADLTKNGGPSQQVISRVVNDKRPHIGQMPDASTLEAFARGFKLPVERIREAAARSLSSYVSDSDEPLETDLSRVPIEAMLHEISRRATQWQVQSSNEGEDGSLPDPIGDQIISSIDPEVDDTNNGGKKTG